MNSYPLAEMDPRLKAYLEEVQRRQMAKDDPRFQQSQGIGNLAEGQEQRDLGLIGSLGKSFAQMGTYNGKAQDASPIANYTGQLQGQAAADNAQRMAQGQQENKDFEGKGKVYQYLQDRIDKNNSEQNKLAFDAKKFEQEAALKRELQGKDFENRAKIAGMKSGPSGGKKLRPLPAGEAGNLGNFEGASNLATQIWDKYLKGASSTGSSITQFMPGSDANNYEAEIRPLIQGFATTLEGGKLAEGDIKRYLDMAPKPGDPNDKALAKMRSLIDTMVEKRNASKRGFEQAGYDTSGYADLKVPEINLPDGDGTATADTSLKPGTIMDDHEYLGGDPGSPSSWKPVEKNAKPQGRW